MKKNSNEYEILMDGKGDFFFGRQLKSGEMSADSVKIEGEHIIKLIAAFFEIHCKKENTDTLLIQNPTGLIVIKQVTVKQLEQTFSQKKAELNVPVRKRTRKTTKTRDN